MNAPRLGIAKKKSPRPPRPRGRQVPPPLGPLFTAVGGRPNSCWREEYLALAIAVRALAPCNFLVFGVGRDSSAWMQTNHLGRTVFLESEEEWIRSVTSEVPGIDVRAVKYPFPFERWLQAGCRRDRRLGLQLEADVAETRWDAILVDAPFGPTTGRHQSGYTATKLVRPGGIVAVHDCDRLREQVVCQHLIEPGGMDLVYDVDRLRLYKARG